MTPREIAEKLMDSENPKEEVAALWEKYPPFGSTEEDKEAFGKEMQEIALRLYEKIVTEAIDAATKPLREEVERLKSQLHYAEKAKDTLRGKRDNVVGPWWVNFEQMLTEEQRDRIGLIEDRGAVLCITRLCDALNEAESSNRALVEALRAAGEAIHSEYCGERDHPECQKVDAALAAHEERSRSPLPRQEREP